MDPAKAQGMMEIGRLHDKLSRAYNMLSKELVYFIAQSKRKP
jgi:hypothetical protein